MAVCRRTSLHVLYMHVQIYVHGFYGLLTFFPRALRRVLNVENLPCGSTSIHLGLFIAAFVCTLQVHLQLARVVF